MVWCVVNAVSGIEFFVIDEAKYFISYPLPFVVPADVGFYPLASLAVPQKSFLRNFLFCARPIFSSKRKRKLFCGTLLLPSRAAGLRFGSGEAEFPPHPPSASPSLWTPTEFVFCFAKCVAQNVLISPLNSQSGTSTDFVFR